MVALRGGAVLYERGTPVIPEPRTPCQNAEMGKGEADDSGQKARQVPLGIHPYLSQVVFDFVWPKSIPTQIRQLILYISNTKDNVKVC